MRSTLGEGTTVAFTFLLAPNVDYRPRKHRDSRVKEPMARSILIIDDEPDIRELVAFKLERIGFQVHVESDSETGMTAIVRLHPDLVVLDWMMPRLSGIDLCERLHERPESERMPIIMLTARAQAADVYTDSRSESTTTSSNPSASRTLPTASKPSWHWRTEPHTPRPPPHHLKPNTDQLRTASICLAQLRDPRSVTNCIGFIEPRQGLGVERTRSSQT